MPYLISELKQCFLCSFANPLPQDSVDAAVVKTFPTNSGIGFL